MKIYQCVTVSIVSILVFCSAVLWVGNSNQALIANDCKAMGQSRLVSAGVVIDCTVRAAP